MNGRRLLYQGSIVICTIGLLVCGGMFLRQWGEYRVGESTYEALAESVVVVPEQETHSPEEGDEKQLEQESAVPQVDFQTLEEINPDVVGWLYSPDTAISYPVVQGQDNSYYLRHLFDKKPNGAGSLFLDYRCQEFGGKNSVIYGHYMKNGTLFASLKEYQDQEYYEAHPLLYLITPQGNLIIRLFSAYIAGPEEEAWQLTFSSEEDYGVWLEERKELSLFESPVTPTNTDRVITLSTCDYTFPNARFVCHGLAEGLT